MAIVTHITNPFDPINNRETVLKDGGLPLHTYFKNIDDNYEIIASVNGHITEDYEAIVKQNDSVAFVAIPQGGGGGGGGKNILRTVAMVALAVAAPGIGNLAVGQAWGAAATFGSSLVAAGVMIGGGMLINTLMPPPTPDFNNPSFGDGYTNSSTYSWGVATNSIEEGTVIPVIYGTARITPPIISQYVETIGNKQYLNMLFALNDGEVTSISDIYINDNPISYYQGVTYDTRLGTNNQTLIPSFDNTRVDTAVSAILSDTSYVTRQGTGNTTNELTVVISAPQGLYFANNTGGLNTVTVPLEIQYREVGSGTWLDLATSPKISAAQNSTVRATYTKSSLTAAQYEIQVKRTTTESTSSRTSDKVYFEAFSEVVYDDFTYPNTALLSIRALATDQLSGGRPRVSALVTANSDNPSLICEDILTTWAGVESANIATTEFDEFETFCDTNDYTCNIVFDTSIDIEQALSTVSQLGRALIVRVGATYMPIVDKADTLPTQGFLFTMGNIIENSFSKEYLPTIDRSNVIDITYFDETLDYERQSLELYQVGFDESVSEIKKSSVAMYGCTDRDMAIKHGRYLLNKAKYLTTTVSFDVAVDAIACKIGDIILVAHDLPQWGYSGRITAAVGNVISLDKEITMLDDGTEYGIQLRLSETDDIVFKNIVVPTGGYTGSDVEVATAYSTQPSKYDVYSFGEINKITKEFKVLNISRSTDQLRKISAIEYIAEVYDDNIDTIPVVNKSSLERVYNLQAVDGTILGSDNGNTAINISWSGNDLSWDIYYKPKSETTYILAGTSTTSSFQIKNIPLGKYDIRIADKTASVNVQGNTVALPDVDNLISYYRNNQTVLTWDKVIDLRSPIDYEVRFGASWDSAQFITRTSDREHILTSNGTYLVKAHYTTSDAVEVYSENATSIVVGGAVLPKNIIASWDEKATNWSGTLTNCFVNDDGNLQMNPAGLFDDIPDFDAVQNLDYYGGVVSEASYEIPASHIVDIGTAQQCRLWVEYEAKGWDIDGNLTFDAILDFDAIENFDGLGDLSEYFTLVVQISIAQDDDIFGDWQNFTAGNYVGKKFKFRGLFYSLDSNVYIELSQAVFYVDMEDKIQSDNNVSIASGGTAITYDIPFQVTPATNITIIDATDGDEIKLTSESSTGFTAQITNSGSGVARSINWVSKGY